MKQIDNIAHHLYEPHKPKNLKTYVNDCINSNWISSRGKYIDIFERKFCNYYRNRYSTAVSNGTTALHLALEALDIGKGDEVIVPTFTYVSPANAILYTGAKAVFIDSKKDDIHIDTDKIEKKINDKTKAIIAVHLYGGAADVITIKRICNKYKLKMIEDCAEALGTKINKIKCGMFADVSTFSFFGNKTLTTGEGGMVLSKSKKINDKVRRLKNQNQSNRYYHDGIGYNYRMTNICAAIGVAQLEEIDIILKKKKYIADLYNEYLPKNINIIEQNPKIQSSHWLVSITVDKKTTRDKLIRFLSHNGIESRPFFYPANIFSQFNNKEKLKNAQSWSNIGINLPSHTHLKRKDVLYISQTISDFFK